jgi:predicted RND superfamily exporter protein
LAASVALNLAFVVAWIWPRAVIRGRWLVLGTFAALTVVSLFVVAHPSAPGGGLTLDPSEEPLLPAHEPARDVYADAVRNFGEDDVMVIGMETPDVFTSGALEAIDRISDAIRRLPGVRSTESLMNATAFRYAPAEDAVEIDPLIDAVPTDPAALADLRTRVLADRIYPRTLVGRDGRTAAINVSFRSMTDGEFVAAGLDESIASILAAEATPERRFFVTGRQHVKARAADIMLHDLVRLLPIAVLVGMVTAWLSTGSVRAGLVPVGVALTATIWTFGLLAALGEPLNLITIVLGPMLLAMSAVYGVQVLARYELLAAEIREPRRAAEDTIRDVALPEMISGVTTIIGFAALLVAPQPAIQDFALFSIFGVSAMQLIAVTGLPALLAMLPLPAVPAAADAAPSTGTVARAIDAFLARMAALATTWPMTILVVWTVLIGAAAAAIPFIVVDTDYLSFFDPRSDVRRDFARASERLVGAAPIYVMVTGPGEGAFREPANVQALERLQRLVDDVPGVSATLSVVDFLAIMNRAFEGGDPSAERIPATREEISHLLFMIPKTKLRRFANTNHSRANLLVRTAVSGSAGVGALRARLDGAIAAARLPADLTAVVTGNTVVFAEASDGIAGNQLSSMVLSALSILLLMVIALRSFGVGLVAMAPNLGPVVVFFGLLGAGLANLSLPTTLIGSVALGIALDDTAHFIVNYQRMRAEGLDAAAAAARCLRELGLPIVTTSLMLTAGYLVLMFSGFATIRQFGWLSALTIQICLWGDLLMLPALLVRTRV